MRDGHVCGCLMAKPNSIVIFTGKMKEVMGLGCLFLKRGGAWNPT